MMRRKRGVYSLIKRTTHGTKNTRKRESFRFTVTIITSSLNSPCANDVKVLLQRYEYGKRQKCADTCAREQRYGRLVYV
jgi:hypothetical protein